MIPKQFRSPSHVVRRNCIYKDVNGSLKLVGQLEEGLKTQVSREQLERLFGGATALNALNAAGAFASVVNLGVSVLGFRHVSRLLRQIEDRIERVEQGLDEIAGLVGVVDQKINQLIGMTEEQNEILARLHGLVLSFETAKVHAALETLAVRSDMPQSPKRDMHLVGAAETLHTFRTWLMEQRASTPIGAIPIRAELLRAEVAIVLAEARALCIAGDAHVACRALQSVLDSARKEVERIYEEFSHEHIGSLLMHPQFEIRDAVEAVSWLKASRLIDGSEHLMSRLGLALAHAKSAATLAKTTAEISLAESELKRQAVLTQLWLDPKQAILEKELDEFTDDENGALKDGLLDDTVEEERLQADAASFITSYRLSRDLESAVAMSAAIEVVGEPVGRLLSDGGSPNSPALVVEWNAGEVDP